jgi:hypothetical protein
VRRHALVQPDGEANVVANRLRVARAARVSQREPDFERAKAAGILRAEIDEVRGFDAKVKVGRVIREGVPQVIDVAHQRAACLERRVEPLVRIDRDGVGESDALREIGRCARHRGSEAAVGAVDVKPEAALPAERRDRGQGDRPRRC